MTEKEAFIIVLHKLMEHPMFIGAYDAKNGSEDFMSGVSTVMEDIAYSISDEIGDKFNKLFSCNMALSQLKSGRE